MDKPLSEKIESIVEPVLVELGYLRVRKGVYRAGSSTSEVNHFVYVFQGIKRKEELSGDFGLRNDVAEEFSCRAIRSYGGKLFDKFECGVAASCAMRFSFVRLGHSGWPVRLSHISNEQIQGHFRAFLAGFLVRKIGQIDTVEKFLSLISSDTQFCPWFASNGAIRAAQIVALAGQIGLDTGSIRRMLSERMPFIANGISKGSEMRVNPEKYVEKILDDWMDRVSHKT